MIIQLHGTDPMQAINIIQSVAAVAMVLETAAVPGMIEETIQMEAHGMEIIKNGV